jgi:hypothetical protein
MSQHREDDEPKSTDEPEAEDDVVPEAGEWPIPPLAGELRPPIGN